MSIPTAEVNPTLWGWGVTLPKLIIRTWTWLGQTAIRILVELLLKAKSCEPSCGLFSPLGGDLFEILLCVDSFGCESNLSLNFIAIPFCWMRKRFLFAYSNTECLMHPEQVYTGCSKRLFVCTYVRVYICTCVHMHVCACAGVHVWGGQRSTSDVIPQAYLLASCARISDRPGLG